jgi:aspartate racemase
MIGILAGMGPKSTAPFIDKVVEVCQQRYGAKNDIDFPPMMIYSCPTPFYIDRPLDHAAMESAIVEGVKRLASIGVDHIAIPCNLAHIYFESIQKAVSVPVLNMVEETIKNIPQNYRKVTVLATSSTIESGIYQKELSHFDKEFVFQPCWQDVINQVLSAIKSGTAINEMTYLWEELLWDVGRSVSAVVIACTDLNIISDRVSSELFVVDSSITLAQIVADKFYSGRRL